MAAFRLPVFPLTCRIWHDYSPASSTYGSPDTGSVCNLSPGKRVLTSIALRQINTPVYQMPMEILFPPLTDVRGLTDVQGADLIEVPKDSHRFYFVDYVDDIGKGFANEHRFALVQMYNIEIDFLDASFPFPVPLP